MGILQSIRDRVSAAREKAAKPGRRLTMTNAKAEPYSQLDVMDADRLQMLLRSAVGGSTRLLFALYRDMILTSAHIQTELGKRKLAVLGDMMRVVPCDKKKADDAAAAAFCDQQISAMCSRQVKLVESNRVTTMTSWRRACSHLLDSGSSWPSSSRYRIICSITPRAICASNCATATGRPWANTSIPIPSAISFIAGTC